MKEFKVRIIRIHMSIELTDRARVFIAEQGFDPVYGARPLRRFIAHDVETRIGRALLSGDVRDGAVIKVDVDQGELVVTYENPSDTTTQH